MVLALVMACRSEPQPGPAGAEPSDPPPPGALHAVGLPRVAPAVVLLVQISPDVISVGGVLDGVEQWVDIDSGPDERYGFRYRVIGQDGEVLLERSTIGPALVESFLTYWSEVAGVDILSSVPNLGRFPLQVPLLPGASHIELQVRDGAGTYVTRGFWTYDLLDQPRIAPVIPPERTERLHGGFGHPADTLDVVLLPDGYTADQLELFATDARAITDKLLGEEPFRSFADRLTVTRLDVSSNESGASYECDTCGFVDNAFGSIYPIELVNRFTGEDYPNRPMFQADQWRVADGIASVPWDVVVVVVNSPNGNGFAVHYATVSRGSDHLGDTAVHEIGHAFGMLGDEYVFDPCVRTPGEHLPENVTDQADRPPWDVFVHQSTPMPTPPGSGYDVGTFAGAWNCPDLYRPSEFCRMKDSETAFCDVCSSLLTRRLLRFGDPASDVRVEGDDLVIEGLLPDTRAIVRYDGRVFKEVAGLRRISNVPLTVRRVDVELSWEPPNVPEDPHGDLRETWSFERR